MSTDVEFKFLEKAEKKQLGVVAVGFSGGQVSSPSSLLTPPNSPATRALNTAPAPPARAHLLTISRNSR